MTGVDRGEAEATESLNYDWMFHVLFTNQPRSRKVEKLDYVFRSYLN